jgi:Fe-Mn family superoxide dismutase
MAMLAQGPYKAQDFQLSGLQGISDQTLQIHLGLYQGYVKNTNLLNERIAELLKEGKASSADFAELSRRLGFEYDGMILHEYYFGALKAGGVALDQSSKLAKAIDASFGSYDAWLADFRGIATMRGVGWAILFQNPANGWLSNHWITLHQDGVPAGYRPILVVDVWEHAFLLDYKPADRPKYIDAVFQNLDWTAVEKNLL